MAADNNLHVIKEYETATRPGQWRWSELMTRAAAAIRLLLTRAHCSETSAELFSLSTADQRINPRD